MQKQAIRYHRFSSEGQSNGSIERQDMITSYWCKNNNVSIIDSFNDDGHSAKTFDRPDMKKLMQFISNHKDKIDYLVVAELTRFSRQLGDAINMVQDVQNKFGIKIVSSGRNMIYDVKDATSFFMMSIEFTMGNTDNLKRESDINGGIYTAKTKEKRYIGAFAPYGYRKEGEKANRNLVIVPEEAELIRSIFDDFISGVPVMQIYDRVKKLGFKRKGNSVIQKILVNPLYIAHQIVKPYKDMPGGLYPANFEPIIDQVTWNQVQHKIKAPKRPGVSLDENVPLRGVLHCHCGRLLTAAPSKGRLGGYYYYYKCNTSSKHNNLSAKKIHAQFVEMLQHMSLTDEMISDMRYYAELEVKKSMKESTKQLQVSYKQLAQVEKDLRSLEEKYIRNTIHLETYNRFFNDAVSRRNFLNAQIEELSKVNDSVFELLEKNLEVLTDLPSLYESLTLELKQEFIREGFDNRLYYKDNVYRTPSMLEIFKHNELILKQKQLLELDEKRDFCEEIPVGGAQGRIIEPLTNFLQFIDAIRVA